MERERILFIDDEQFVLDGLKRLLREFRHKWQMEFALNGKEALKMVQEKEFDVIITDIRMPEMTGLELLERLQADEKTKKIPVVILTGLEDRTLKRKALDLGAVDLLNKPVNKEDLVARINNVLRIKHYRDLILEKNQALEKQLVISQKMDLVGVMAAGAVHDLSNLISIIVGYSNLLIEENLLETIEMTSMEKIRRAGEKASGLVNQILKFSRLDERISTINVGDLISDIVSILATTLPEDINIVWQKPNEPIFIKSNAVKLQQVLLNLCINGIQAMAESGGSLTLSLDRAGENMVRIDVTDTGVGMDDETKEKIYNPLFTTKEEDKGTGLGLFVVNYILDEYNGKIEVQSQQGKGTTFRVFFPLFLEQPLTPNQTQTGNRTSDNDFPGIFISGSN
ncbi:MAG: response regulator [Candidatus Aminicenantes bacterium]|nr:response regulator [Candidatus Aminicenantes bacterium]NIM79165.1 response regulator [Candidatus Aminicenantes bacterium]NIN18450.1 response regulator [Candidatus Aminicenantes bacterium]NIN42338.1 response regulator [Candidatus Aminicenantes bacterium]NIN85104.1 response regulator [Candidatus Aminicenantes bacterium]